MECRIIRHGERDRVGELHRELVAFDPALGQPPFRGNPVSSEPDFPFLFYFIEDGTILGTRRAIPDIVHRGGRSYPLAWSYDTVVQPAARGKGIGTKLVAAQVEEFDRSSRISAAAFSAAAMMRIYDKLGYTVLGFVPRYALVRDSAAFLESKLGNAALAKLVSIPGNVALSALARMRGARNTEGLAISRVDTLEWQHLTARLPEPSDIYHWDDGPDWAAARLQPGDACYAVRSGKADRTIALFVLRDRRSELGEMQSKTSRSTIMHYRYDGTEAGASALACALADQLYRDGKTVADIVTSDPLLQSKLARLGFARREEGMTFVFKTPPGMALPGAGERSDWKLTHFCSDGFLFP